MFKLLPQHLGDVRISRLLPVGKLFADVTRIHRRQEIDPVIHVYGDAAVVAYYFDIPFDMNGQTIHSEGRGVFFMVKEEGRRWGCGRSVLRGEGAVNLFRIPGF